MLEYAIHESSNLLVHVDSVQNGKKCGCFCPHCKDLLIARNNPKNKKRRSFAHQNIVESRSCLMTQLHLVAQQHFHHLTEYQIPDVRFKYKDYSLYKPAQLTNVIQSSMEQPVDEYIADVFLNTEVGDIAIEIFVTHECEDEKKQHYIDRKLISIEYDLSELRDLEIHKAIERLKTNTVPYTWMYPWSHDEMIEKHEEELSQKKKNEFIKQRDSARKSAYRFIKESRIRLPSLIEKIECSHHGISYEKNINLIKQSSYDLDELSIFSERNDCLILAGHKNSRGISRSIWVVYQYYDQKPEILDSLQGSVIIRSQSVKSGAKAIFQWYRHEKHSYLLKKEIDCFNQSIEKSVHAGNKIEQLANEFTNSRDLLFNKSYMPWRTWMIEKSLFQPSAENKNPSIPSVLKKPYLYPPLWVFNTWPIYVLSVLAETVDNNLSPKVSYSQIFDKLSKQFPVRKDFLTLENDIDSSIIYVYPELYERAEIIKEALNVYQNLGAIEFHDDYVYRRRPLLPSISLPTYRPKKN